MGKDLLHPEAPPCEPAAPVVLPPLARRAFSASDGQALTFAASLLDAEGAALLASGRWGEGHAANTAADILRKLRTMGAAEDSPDSEAASAPTPAASVVHPC